MDDKIINVLTIVLVSFVCLSDLLVSEDASGFELKSPGNFSCVNQLTNGNFTLATNCTNGRGLLGCCVDRAHCDYNTSNIDLTMYATKGFKGGARTDGSSDGDYHHLQTLATRTCAALLETHSHSGSCFNTYVCCPLHYVKPITLTNSTAEDNNLDGENMNKDEDF